MIDNPIASPDTSTLRRTLLTDLTTESGSLWTELNQEAYGLKQQLIVCALPVTE
jgi:hypothetical protein